MFVTEFSFCCHSDNYLLIKIKLRNYVVSLNYILSGNYENKQKRINRIMVLGFLVNKSKYRAKKLVSFSMNEIFNVVADVKSYEEFLPFCTKSTIIEKICDDDDSKHLKATLEIGFPPIIENYTSTIVTNKPHSVQANCKDGKLFEYLETTWIFNPVPLGDPNTCIVDFSIRFQFKSVFYSHLASIFFNNLVKHVENAFIDEARRRYGRMSAPVFEINDNDDEEYE